MNHELVHLSDLLSDAVKRARRVFVAGIVLCFLMLEAFIISSEYDLSKRRLNEWIILNQPQIEQALFLENALSIQGLLEQFKTPSDEAFKRSIAIFSPEKKRIQGTLDHPGELPEGFTYRVFPPSIRYYSSLKFGGKDQGSLLIHGSLQIFPPVLHTLVAATICALIYVLFQSLVSALIVTTEVQAVRPLQRLKEAMNEFSAGGKISALTFGSELKAIEVRDVSLGFNALIKTIEAYSKRESTAAAVLAKQDLAAQVAHDIKSPLATLRLGLEDLEALPADTLQITKQAIDRISDISHQLLFVHRRDNVTENAERAPESVLVSSSLEEIVAEKRVQLRSRLDLALELQIEPQEYGAFSKLERIELKRLISNLIDNAVQATPGPGKVTIQLSIGKPNYLTIAIEDTGTGLPPDITHLLGERGVSSGKKDGSGLGIYHAKRSVERWGGSIRFESPISNRRGTRVSVELPSSPVPSWFGRAIDLAGIRRIVVLDDDESIHMLWKRRLSEVTFEKSITVEHFSSPTSLKRELSSRPGDSATIYLIDYELGVAQTGIALIEELRIALQSFLVTSHSDDSEIQRQAEDLGLRIIPKSFAAWIPIKD
jgi:signal transduction histidine kinase